MYSIIGPVLARLDGYAFDTWTRDSGLRCGFGYRRIDDAYYARNAARSDAAQRGEPGAVLCDTLEAFIAQVESATQAAEIHWQAASGLAAVRPALAA